jgi:hypothetical protein
MRLCLSHCPSRQHSGEQDCRQTGQDVVWGPGTEWLWLAGWLLCLVQALWVQHRSSVLVVYL